MNYEFYQNSILNGFIKRILKDVRLPVYDIVHEGDFIIKDCYYIFNSLIIKCVETGYLYNDKHNFEYIKYYQEFEKLMKDTFSFTSTINYYDAQTHRYLGEYLRVYKGLNDINLLPFYNCFVPKEIEDFYIEDYDEEEIYDPHIEKLPYKGVDKTIFLIPVKFNKTYTIALDCFDTIEIIPIFYNRIGRILKDGNGNYLDEALKIFYKKFSYTSTRQPVTWRISLETIVPNQNEDQDSLLKSLYDQEDNLYMMFQLPKMFDSSIVILEGDFANKVKLCDTYISSIENGVSNLQADFLSPLSLLLLSTKSIVPFSNRLVEYLLGNVISSEEKIYLNIGRVLDYTNTIKKLDLSYGVWDEKLLSYLFLDYLNNSVNSYKWDITGFVDKDIEKYITKGLKV